ncbi:MAG: uspa protein [Verrucomicrobiales bacterium]|nr:uspa protein [Verrucomicrobiales bacterium]
MDRFISPATLKNDNKERTAGAENELKALLEAFAEERLIHGRQLVRTGKPYEEIIETARETKSEVIVLGSHGYTGIRRVYLGSTAERVVRHAPCHVLVVRE